MLWCLAQWTCYWEGFAFCPRQPKFFGLMESGPWVRPHRDVVSMGVLVLERSCLKILRLLLWFPTLLMIYSVPGIVCVWRCWGHGGKLWFLDWVSGSVNIYRYPSVWCKAWHRDPFKLRRQVSQTTWVMVVFVGECVDKVGWKLKGKVLPGVSEEGPPLRRHWSM